MFVGVTSKGSDGLPATFTTIPGCTMTPMQFCGVDPMLTAFTIPGSSATTRHVPTMASVCGCWKCACSAGVGTSVNPGTPGVPEMRSIVPFALRRVMAFWMKVAM